MVTLHAYILRELLKTFALTLAGLTALFTMGGGLYNVLRYEGVSAGDLFGFIPMLIPIMAALAMPVAALFAATMVYGRLAADNELLACRAAGVNIHRLFASAVLLSFFVAIITLLFSDMVVPDLTRRLDHYVRTNLRDLAIQKMQDKGHVRYELNRQRYLLTAKSVGIPTQQALREQNLPTEEGISYLFMEAPVFLFTDEDTLVRCASAEHGLCQFDARSTPLEITLFVHEGRDFDVKGSSARLKRQQIGPIVVPLKFPRRASMVDLKTLARWREQPWKVDKLKPAVREFRLGLIAQQFVDDCRWQIAAGKPITLTNERDQTYQITAATCDESGKGVRLRAARVVRLESGTDRPMSYDAPLVVLHPRPAVSDEFASASTPTRAETLLIKLDLQRTPDQPVVEHNPRARNYEEGTTKAGFSLPDLFLMPNRVYQQVRQYPEKDLFDPSVELDLKPTLAERRGNLLKKVGKQRRKMASLIHFRLGVASSALVTVIMAAALGVIFRGARALAAFGLACVPFGGVAVLIVMARSLGEKEGTEMLSPLLTWGGLALVAVVDLLILRLGVRR